MTAYPTGKVIALTEHNGAPRHDDEKTKQLIKAAVQSALKERDQAVVSEIRDMAGRIEKGFHRLAQSMEAFVSGESEVAVAALTPDLQDDLPSLSSFKASPLVIYSLKASDIAMRLGLNLATVSYLLNSHGLNWTVRKPELWDKALYDKTGRRLWHVRIVELLRDVIATPAHSERNGVTSACGHLLARAASQLMARV